MRLYATVTSERASKGQGGNEFVLVEFTLADKSVIGQVELYLYDDDVRHGANENEYLLKWREGDDEEDNDWDILTQGHIPSDKKKGKREKGECQNKDANGNACWDCESGLGEPSDCGTTKDE